MCSLALLKQGWLAFTLSQKISQAQTPFSLRLAFSVIEVTTAQLIQMNLSLSEARLAKDCAAGHRTAQKALYEQYCDDMMLLCSRYIANAEDAREVLMDGFLNCFKSIGSFQARGEGSLKAWLKKIMVNSCLMHLRKRTVASEELGDDVEIGVDSNLLEALSAKEIMALIQGLPTGYRTVFNLYFFEDCTHREIAQLLGVSENTSKSQLAKAKTALQRLLTAYN